MTKVIATASVEELLGNLREKTEILDATGKVIGYFMPKALSDMYAEARKHIDPEEIKRRKQLNERTYTTQEVLERLKSMETQ